MTSPDNIGEQLGRIEVQDQSPDPVPITIRRIGHQVLDRLGVDSTTHDSAGVMRAGEAQRAQDIAAQSDKAPSELACSPIEAKRANQLIENTQGNIKSYDKDADLLGATSKNKLL